MRLQVSNMESYSIRIEWARISEDSDGKEGDLEFLLDFLGKEIQL